MMSIKSRAKRQHEEALLEQQSANATGAPPEVPPETAEPQADASGDSINDTAAALSSTTDASESKGDGESGPAQASAEASLNPSRKKAKTSKEQAKDKELAAKDKELKAQKRDAVNQKLQKLKQERLGFAALTVEEARERVGIKSFSDIKALSRSEVIQVLLTLRRENYAENPAFRALFTQEHFRQLYGDKPKLKTSKGRDSLEQLKTRLAHYLLLEPQFDV